MKVLVLGAGQLARMMALAGAPLGINVSAYDVRSSNIVHPLTQAVLGHGLDNAITQADVITAEFEHISHSILDICDQSGKLLPSAEAIQVGGDRRLEKVLLDDAAVNNAKYYVINQREDFDTAINHVGLPMVLKSTLGGYDGKGQWRLTNLEDIESTWQEMLQCIQETPNQAIVAEEFVSFDREVSLVGIRDKNGEIKVYPLAENIHTNGVLTLSTAIADTVLQNQAKKMFEAIAERLEYVGVLAIEFFDVKGKLLVNEIAPRVHNSGHWTQQGTDVCQFENHLRAICGLPLGETKLLRPTVMINILGEDKLPNELFTVKNCHIHWYGKEKRAGRKMGHINLCANSSVELSEHLLTVTEILDESKFPNLRTEASKLNRS